MATRTPASKAALSLLIVAICVQFATAGETGDPSADDEVRTPETRTLTAEEATRVLQRDWLFQAMGEPLLKRAAKEIDWARQLAARLTRKQPDLDLSSELKELEFLEKRLAKLGDEVATTPMDKRAEAMPDWIWYPEGAPAADAPAEPRFFRHRFNLPSTVLGASLRVAADDKCEVYLNGTRLGAQGGWGQTSVFSAWKLLVPGENVLAVRAQNMPAPTKNPAGLILHLAVTLADGKQVAVISDTSWLAEKLEREGWEQPDFDDSGWKEAILAAPYGGGPWGKIGGMDKSNLKDHWGFAYANVDPAVKELYFSVRRAKRDIMFKNPVLDFSQLMFIDQPLPDGPESLHEAIHRMGIMAVPGGRLLVLDGLHPGGKLRQLAPEIPGSFWKPDLSFDAQKVLFCFKPHEHQSFHLYEINLDGTGLVQLTESEYDDVDPIYLPDGHIIFTTTRGNSYVRCGPFIYSYVLARCDGDGGNVYLISHNGEPDFVPSLMQDGRVIYSRWEYSDKPLWRIQSLWTTNPDGTNTAVFWGNQSVWPDHLAEPRQIPGSRRVMFCGVGHHDWWSGCIGIIDPDKGFNFPHGLTKVTMDRPWPECGNGPVDPAESQSYHASGKFTGYQSPCPLAEDDFLVSARGDGNLFRLYLMDTDGNRDLIYEGLHNIWHAIPIKPRPSLLRQPDRVAWPGTGKDRKPSANGVFYSADVYQGMPGVPRGSVKYLRVFQLDHKTYSTWNKSYRHSGPAVSIVQEEGVKRILSEVPVEADGSVYFKVPVGRSLYFQLLDGRHRCLQTMRSFTGVMPGEQRGCVGCHELHSTTPPRKTGLAFRRPPTDLTPPPWGTQSISFERFVQPVLDKYCGDCHQGEGEGREALDLTSRPGVNIFKEPYLTLVGTAGWHNPIPGTQGKGGYGIAGAIPVENMTGPEAYQTLPPMQHLSFKSKLVEMSANGQHYETKADPLSLRKLMAWVDACCPYLGEEEVRALDDPVFAGVENLPIRPRVKTAPVIERP
jgi:hydrazine synthase alpha subunit-like protein